ncbi:UNVERIFIED_CONTAM: BTB/POZ domain-containing protein FBL11 [Sesamum angustifolium]|uniref:BTB/POZ domain-containing protein FBL11 n=1 Tax=Sesamum angustifolium TaxID=2727405 RepID=A0AAW2MR88_9LAMI
MKEPDEFAEIVLSTADISSWDLPSVLAHKLLKIEVNPTGMKLAQLEILQCMLVNIMKETRRQNVAVCVSSMFLSYFQEILRRNGLTSVSIHWNVESFANVLRFIFGCPVKLLPEILFLNEAALFFGVETLLLKCRVWLEEFTSQSQVLCLDSLIDIWKYGLERANDSILQLCISYLARNFVSALALTLPLFFRHFGALLLFEKHFADAVLVWLTANTAKSEGWSSNDLCLKIRTGLLPLWFAAGKRRCHFFCKFADKATGAILSLAGHNCTSLTDIFTEGCTSDLRIRLTKYTQKVDVSGCPQITAGLCLLSVLPSCDADWILSKIIKKSSVNHANSLRDGFRLSLALGQVLTFEAVQELDISNCPSLFLESAINCFCKSFPSLRTLRAAYFSNFKTRELGQWVQKFPLLTNIDLTLDITPVIPAKVSIVASSSVPSLEPSTASSDIYNCQSATSLSYISRPLPSNVIKLTLEGRTDISDSDLLVISEVCPSLSYINLKGCTSVTDHGIAVMILRCKMLQSVLACDTSFRNNSILALSSGISSVTQHNESHFPLIAHKLLTLHIGGCHGASLEMLDVSDTEVSVPALVHVICRNPDLKSLKIRGCRHLLRQESETKERKLCIPSFTPQDLYSELGKSCKLEEFEVGWGFSFFSLATLKPAITTLRSLVVGLGGSLGHDGLKLLPTICPMLDTLILYFQRMSIFTNRTIKGMGMIFYGSQLESDLILSYHSSYYPFVLEQEAFGEGCYQLELLVISDSAITAILRTLPHLQFLALCYCFGDISSLSFKVNVPNLRNLKLERVTPWMTNEELATLAENCTNLVKLSLIGCTLLDSDDCINWPEDMEQRQRSMLTFINPSNMLWKIVKSNMTINRTWFSYNLGLVYKGNLVSYTEKVLTEGCGIPRNFIIYAASKLPMLRKISLDVCDASEGDFDIPSVSIISQPVLSSVTINKLHVIRVPLQFSDRHFLSTVKIARCFKRTPLDPQPLAEARCIRRH